MMTKPTFFTFYNKGRLFARLHGILFQKMTVFLLTTMGDSVVPYL